MSLFGKEKDGDHCPYLDKKCIERKCKMWTLVQGKDPQSNKIIDSWGCAIAWLPVLIVENSQRLHQTNATVQAFRNENSTGVQKIGETVAGFIQLIGEKIPLLRYNKSDRPKALPEGGNGPGPSNKGGSEKCHH